MKIKLNVLALSSVLALAPVAAFANAQQVVFDQLFVSDGANGVASASGNALAQFEAGDNFSLSADATLSGLIFAGNRDNDQFTNDSFVISIYADDPSFPGAPSIAPLWSQNVGNIAETALNLTDVNGNALFRYEVAIAGPALLGGQQYWLTIVNELTDRGNWFWSFSDDGADGFNAGRSLGSPVDFDVFADGDFAFTLLSEAREVPTPASFALLGAGLAMAGLARRKRA